MNFQIARSNRIVWVLQCLTWSVVVVGGLLLILHVTMTQQLGHADRGSLLIVRPDEETNPNVNHPERQTNKRRDQKICSLTFSCICCLMTNPPCDPRLHLEMPVGGVVIHIHWFNTHITNKWIYRFGVWVGVKHTKRNISGENERWG